MIKQIMNRGYSAVRRMPLEGIRVIDASRILVGSFATL